MLGLISILIAAASPFILIVIVFGLFKMDDYFDSKANESITNSEKSKA